MTRSSDLVMVEREPTEAMLNAAHDWSMAKYGIGIGNDAAAECWQAMIAAALQSVEGGVQGSIATKQESCPESAPRTETAIVAALRECQRVLAMMIDPASIKSTSVIHAFAAATATEAKARAVLSGVTKSDGGVEGHAECCQGLPASVGSKKASSAVDVAPETGLAATGYPRTAGIKPGPSDQLTKTPSADHDAGNLRSLAEPNNHQPHALSQGWQPIETAPEDGDILIFVPRPQVNSIWIGQRDFETGNWFDAAGDAICALDEPTHWMPLPAPPSPDTTPRDSSGSTTGGTAPDHTTMEGRGR